MKRAVILVVLVAAGLAVSGCEWSNKVARKQVTVFGGDFRVTYASDSHVKSWIVKNGKVTSAPDKGYYFFWAKVDGKDKYVQTPIDRTYIEEL